MMVKVLGRPYFCVSKDGTCGSLQAASERDDLRVYSKQQAQLMSLIAYYARIISRDEYQEAIAAIEASSLPDKMAPADLEEMQLEFDIIMHAVSH